VSDLLLDGYVLGVSYVGCFLFRVLRGQFWGAGPMIGRWMIFFLLVVCWKVGIGHRSFKGLGVL